MMEGKAVIFLFSLLAIIVTIDSQYKAGNCPLISSTTKCMPTCVNDFQCGFTEKCCPNRCGSKSCTSSSPVSTNSGGYKGSNDGPECGGRTCSRYEKCQFNKSSKRYECVRS